MLLTPRKPPEADLIRKHGRTSPPAVFSFHPFPAPQLELRSFSWNGGRCPLFSILLDLSHDRAQVESSETELQKSKFSILPSHLTNHKPTASQHNCARERHQAGHSRSPPMLRQAGERLRIGHRETLISQSLSCDRRIHTDLALFRANSRQEPINSRVHVGSLH